MIRKAAVQAGVVAAFALILWNGYVVFTHVSGMRRIAALTSQSSMIQAEISEVAKDLTDIEAGERAYLITDNSSYLQPYVQAKDRIAGDFTNLRAGLANRGERDRSVESEVESLASSNQPEMEHAINLRKRGYRQRAFKFMASTDTLDAIDKARQSLSSLAMAESNKLASIETDRNAGLGHILKETALLDLGLLALLSGLFLLVQYHGRVLEQKAAQGAQQLASQDFHLAKLMSALSNEARSKTSAIGANAHVLLKEYGGFLPRHGYTCAEQIEEASAQLEQLRQDLIAYSGSGSDAKPVCEAAA